MEVDRLIAVLRERGGPESVPARQAGEWAAREILNSSAGRFTREDCRAFSHHVQTSHWDGRETYERFLPAFGAGSWSGLTKDLARFNGFTAAMWEGAEADALDLLDRVFRTRSVLPWAGTSYPSLLMYLRDPETYVVAIQGALVKGLEALAGRRYPMRNADDYLAYCRDAQELRVKHRVAPQELDLLLWAATSPPLLGGPPRVHPVQVRDRVEPVSSAPAGDAEALQEWSRENEQRAAELPLEYLASKAAATESVPRRVDAATSAFVRNPYVAALAKRLAGGTCDLCGKDAPFASRDGSPYLEAHHVVWLSRGGVDAIENVAALCPNCHRRMHVLEDAEDASRLRRGLSERRR